MSNHDNEIMKKLPSQGCDEPYTVETLKFPKNVKIFYPPNPNDPIEVQQAHIRTIQESIRETQDGPIEKYWKPNNPETTYYTYTSGKHFSSHHYALLFAPGEYYNCDFEIGYYVQMAGLGSNATDVQFTGNQRSGPFVEALNKQLPVSYETIINSDGSETTQQVGTIAYPGSGLSLDTFWRCAENFSLNTPVGMMWAVSQAAPLRRIHIQGDGNLLLSDHGAYASGGYLANAIIDNHVDYASQQQWFTRNCKVGGIDGGAWNLVFSGCDFSSIPEHSVPQEGIATHDNDLAITIDPDPKIRVEKPFIVLHGREWELHVPKPIFDGELLCGASLTSDATTSFIRSFEKVKVVIPREVDKDADDERDYNTLDHVDQVKTTEIQMALDEGKDVVLCPGEYFLTKALEVKTTGQVIIGIGLATLIAPQDGSPCIRVKSRIPDVRIAGIMLEASLQTTSSSKSSSTRNSDGVKSLLEIGEPDVADEGDPQKPVVLSDVFARVGGSNVNRNVSTNVIVRIHSGNVVGDNLWLWRADHVKLRKNEKPNDPKFPLYHQIQNPRECKVETALEVRGHNVTMFGLFCEHTNENQLIWKGNNGTTLFYQCELPYDAGHDFAHSQHGGYIVDDSVEHHTAKGIGVYSNFTVNEVFAASGIRYPTNSKVNIVNPFTVYLSNKGGISNVINDEGDAVHNPANEQLVSAGTKVSRR